MKFDFLRVSVEDAMQEQLMEALRNTANCRNNMGGAMYWSILNDQACELGSLIVARFPETNDEIKKLLGVGNFVSPA